MDTSLTMPPAPDFTTSPREAPQAQPQTQPQPQPHQEPQPQPEQHAPAPAGDAPQVPDLAAILTAIKQLISNQSAFHSRLSAIEQQGIGAIPAELKATLAKAESFFAKFPHVT